MKKICVIDYDSGNIRSVYNALKKIIVGTNCSIFVTSDEKKINDSSHIILPGVGAFSTCIEGLRRKNILRVIEKKVFENPCPFLGICVGMQMMSSKSYEKGVHDGLNWIPGDVKKIETNKNSLKIPHMGWNKLILKKENGFIKKLKKKIDLKKNNDAYFVHSYSLILKDNTNLIFSTDYGMEITAMISNENLIGTQFHPEKSHLFGLNFLETFIEMN